MSKNKKLKGTDNSGSVKTTPPYVEASDPWVKNATLHRVIDQSGDQDKKNPQLTTPPDAVAKRGKEAKPTENIHGKTVLYREAKTVLSMASDFVHKLLCTGPVLNLGDACVFSCVYCYVESVARKLIFDLLGKRAHQDVVVRRRNALEVLKGQLGKNKDKKTFHVVYSSSLVDIAATVELLKETASACIMILEQTAWDIRLLTKSSFLPQLVKLIPEKYKKRLILGVSTGTFDDEVGKVIEQGTALVSKRIQSLHWLQDNGYRTFGMVCPSLPQKDYAAFTEEAARLLRYDRCEHVWCEVINLRGESFTQTIAALDTAGLIEDRDRLALVCGDGAEERWEAYARATFEAHKTVVPAGKLRFLQYVGRDKDLPHWKKQVAHGAVVLGAADKRATKKATSPQKATKALITKEETKKVRDLLDANQAIERQTKKSFSDWFENGVVIGGHFARVKADHPGKYLTYLVTNFKVNRRTANNYVVLFEEQEGIRAQLKMGNVSHATGAYRLARKGKQEKKRHAQLVNKPVEVKAEAVNPQPQLLLMDKPKAMEAPAVKEVVEVAASDKAKPFAPTFEVVKAPAHPVIVASVPENVLAEMLDVVKKHEAECQHQTIREDGEIKLNAYFMHRLGLAAA